MLCKIWTISHQKVHTVPALVKGCLSCHLFFSSTQTPEVSKVTIEEKVN